MRFLKRILLIAVCVNIFILLLAGCIKPAYQVAFIDEACIKPNKRYSYHTCHSLAVVINKKEERDVFEIPKDFKTDLASIPRLWWSVLSPAYSSFIYPAILHDYLYTCPGFEVSRRYADDIFYSALIAQGVSQFTATVMYMSVRMFGNKHFQKGQYCLPEDRFAEMKDIVFDYST